MHKFKNLEVYRKSLQFARTVRETTKKFPRDELFGLTSQFRRAAYSIVLNIAEGAGNSSRKEFAKFLGYSIRSGFECPACVDISLEIGFIDPQDHGTLSNYANELIAMLYGLQKSLTRG